MSIQKKCGLFCVTCDRTSEAIIVIEEAVRITSTRRWNGTSYEPLGASKSYEKGYKKTIYCGECNEPLDKRPATEAIVTPCSLIATYPLVA